MPISTKINNLMRQGSWIRRMFEEGAQLKAQYGEDSVFDLSLGNPIIEPPPQFFDELRRLADAPLSGAHRYMPNAGYGWVRAAVAAQLGEETGLALRREPRPNGGRRRRRLERRPQDAAGPGRRSNSLRALLRRVSILRRQPRRSLQDRPARRPIPCRTSTPSAPRSDLEPAPSSSTARTTQRELLYPSETLADLADAIQQAEREHDIEICLVSDEPYRRILFDGLEYPHVFHHHPRAIVATSHSKDLALPGERIGYIAIHPQMPDAETLMDGLVFSNRTLGFVNAPALMQRVVASLQSVTVDVAQYQRKRDFLYDALTDIGYQLPETGRRLLYVPPLADRRRHSLRSRVAASFAARRPRRRLRLARPLPNILLRGRRDPATIHPRLRRRLPSRNLD